MKRLIFIAMFAAASAPVLANDVDPFGFEKEHAPSSMTRAEAVAVAQKAQPVQMRIDDQGRLITSPSTKSRAQVAAEAAAAGRLGLHRFGDLGPVQLTAEQDQEITLAGLRAIGQSGSLE
jgi:hypothetical protein